MRNGTTRFILSLATALFMMFGAQQLLAAETVEAVHAQGMVKQGALLLDVREPDEFATEHAPTAQLIPLEQFSARMQEVAAYKDKPVIVMCRTGRRSAKAAQLLQDAGFSQVSSVEGGIEAWKKAGLEVVAEPVPVKESK